MRSLKARKIVSTETLWLGDYGDITVTQKLTSFLSLNVGVKNLFNLTDIRTIVESANDTPSVSYLGCGRSYFIGLNLMLNGKFKK